MTRTEGHLIICVHETSFARLSEDRAAFLAACECCTVNEFVERINELFVNNAKMEEPSGVTLDLALA